MMEYVRQDYCWIRKQKFPNLLAEIKESGYSISTIRDHMGMGRYGDIQEVWDKITGKADMFPEEIAGLAGLFGVDIKYLITPELVVIEEKSMAYWRHYELNRRLEEQSALNQKVERIAKELLKNPDLLYFISDVIEKQLDVSVAIGMIHERNREIESNKVIA